MITLNHLVRRSASVAAPGFREFWLTEHARRLLDLTGELGVGRLVKCETRHADEANTMLQAAYRTATDAYDFVDQLVINDLAVFKAGLARPDVRAEWKALGEAENVYVERARSDYWFSVEHAQVLHEERCTAGEENARLKVYYVARRSAALTQAEAHLHWNACHGALARQFVDLLPFVKYVQGHRLESRVCDELKSILGGGFADSAPMLGQAEVWLERMALAGLQTPESQRMLKLLTDDIDLFIEAGRSHVFATKEHVLLDRPLVSDRLPRLFSGD